MSFILASGEAISNSQLNHSCSKQMYSFPKTPRFQSLKRSTSATFIYNIPSMMSQRKAYIGYGHKSDFTKGKDINVPYYSIARLFETPHPTAPKYTFGVSREHFRKVLVNKRIAEPPKSPGPARYSYLKPFGSEAPKYTMNKRYPLKAMMGRVNSPGPARYNNNININKEGRYTLSQFSNTPKSVWSLSKVKRLDYIHDPKTPGANAYHLEELTKGSGKIYNSRFQSACGKTISSKFGSYFDTGSITPGPGSYQTFSEFGIYKSNMKNNIDKKKTSRSFYKATRKMQLSRKSTSRSKSTLNKLSKTSLSMY